MLQPLQLGWIDYGSQDRNKILSVLSLLTAPEAVDELGIGVVRDGFADVLFPGTSTIQTRAKYFFIVPYLLMELEQEKNLTPKTLLQLLSRAELDLIPLLNKNNAQGVIGARAGESLQRKPSSIYWNGLYMYGILHTSTRLSLEGYARAVCKLKAEAKQITATAHQDKGEGTDDLTAIQSGRGSFWRAPFPPENWRENMTIDLTAEEARFLREKVINSPHSANSLLAYLLNNNKYEVTEFDNISAVGRALELPEALKADYEMAERFATFIYGANIRYNVILSSGQNDTANERWERWYQSVIDSQFIYHYDASEPFTRLGLSLRNRARTLPFLNKWRQAVIGGKLDEMNQLIIAREIELKGKGRAKLQNSENFRWSDGLWLGGGRLEFRFRTAKQIIKDIREGLGDDYV